MNKKYLPVKWLTPEEFNRLFDKVLLLNRKYKLSPGITRVNLIVYNKDFIDKYSVDLIAGKKPSNANVGSIANVFKKYVPVITEGYGRKEISDPTFDLEGHTRIDWDYWDPGNYSYVNPQYKLKKINCYSYDINSAYSYAMCQMMPDTEHPKFDTIVGPGEIGFRMFTKVVPIATEGKYADVVFKLIESPYKSFIAKYFKLKQNEPQNSKKRQYYKDILNIPSGLLHRYNIFHRLMTLYWAKKYVMQFIDKNTVYCNVDSIVSLKQRTDLPIGDELGQFKEEHKNDTFKYKTVGVYQWNDEIHYSGIPSKAINDIEDIKNLNQFTRYYFKEGYIWPM